jgi:hypothetical protein
MLDGLQRLTSILVKKKKFEGTKSLKYYIHPHSNVKMIYELVHTVTIIYSIFVIPLLTGFRYPMSSIFQILEAVIFFEQLAYLICNIRTAQFIRGVLTLDMKLNLKTMKEHGFYLEIIALVPFNLIFSTTFLNF